MIRSVKKYYEHKRSYDYSDAYGRSGHRTINIMQFVKKRAHKRLRKQDVLLKDIS